MTYIDGFVVPVPASSKAAYAALAGKAALVFKEHGATSVVECWGDDVPAGEQTDFTRSVEVKDDEIVVFSWVEWPSKAVRDEAGPKVMADPRMQPEGEMPFDGKRMIFGGFESLVEA